MTTRHHLSCNIWFVCAHRMMLCYGTQNLILTLANKVNPSIISFHFPRKSYYLNIFALKQMKEKKLVQCSERTNRKQEEKKMKKKLSFKQSN